MAWNASLDIDYQCRDGRSVALHQHDGPLRVLQSLYPEGDAICHNVLVHPPGGLVGGDRLDIRVTAGGGAHGLISTPGATRFYRSDGERAAQHVRLSLADGARLEWLPLESIAHSGCDARNRLRFELAPSAELMAWDVTALGLPASAQPFERGGFEQHIEWPGHWLERARIAADDTRLLNSPLGLAGQRCIGTLWFASGTPLPRARRERLLDLLRAQTSGHELRHGTGVTSPNEHIVVVRTLAPLVEPAMALFKTMWAALRAEAWKISATPPRIWSV